MDSADKITQVNEIVDSASKHADLPRPPVSGFDGDAWRWIWRGEVKSDRFAEVHLRIADDVITHELHAELQSLAWVNSNTRISRSMPVLSLTDFASHLQECLDRNEQRDQAIVVLAGALNDRWGKVVEISHRLEEYEQRTHELEKQFAEKINEIEPNSPDSMS